jgi:hypothetical protein
MPFITWASWPIQIIASKSLKQSHSNTYLNSKAPRNQGLKIKDNALGSVDGEGFIQTGTLKFEIILGKHYQIVIKYLKGNKEKLRS